MGFFQEEEGIRDHCVSGVEKCALTICSIIGQWNHEDFSHRFLYYVDEDRKIENLFFIFEQNSIKILYATSLSTFLYLLYFADVVNYVLSS